MNEDEDVYSPEEIRATFEEICDEEGEEAATDEDRMIALVCEKLNITKEEVKQGLLLTA